MRLKYLFEKYVDKTASSEERAELAELINIEGNKDMVIEFFNTTWENYQGDGMILPVEKSEEILNQILGKDQSMHQAPNEKPAEIYKIRRIWWQVAAAAAVLLIVAGGFWIGRNKKQGQQPFIAANTADDVKPGTYKARLTLSDGSKIIIDSAAPGQLAIQGNTTVSNKDGQLIYQTGKNNQEVIYNTISTNKGETYSFVLADGSKIWLNSGSSVHFPVAFPGKERRIEITGEVFVKVAKNPAQPFIASAKGMEVLALGTEFNINSYSDEENISTTLIEGSVRVSKGSSFAILKPGQQTQLNGDQQLTAAKEVNTDEMTAWKDGWFHFESADMKTILRQFARWYDVEVVYEEPVKNRKFFGFIKRSSSLKNVLEILQDNDIIFRIMGKKLIVKSG